MDFAFVDKKIDVEIDGEQHYRPESIEHDNKRDTYLNNNGWIIYRISWLELRNNFYKEFTEFENFINSDLINNRTYDKNIVINDYKTINYCSCGKEIEKKSKKCINCHNLKQRKVDRPILEILIKEVKELGYTGTGRKYGVSDNAVRKWLNAVVA